MTSPRDPRTGPDLHGRAADHVRTRPGPDAPGSAGRPHPVHLFDMDAPAFRARLDEALAVYVAAMRYPRGTEQHRAPLWSEHATREGWQAVGAEGDDGRLVAIGYGYHGRPQQWWNQQVRAGLQSTGRARAEIDAVLSDYFELTELHVDPRLQGGRIGELVLRRLLAGRSEATVLLSTPEVAAEDNRAWRLYRRLGFVDVVRRYTFSGDSRPFAILGRHLPLPPPDGSRTGYPEAEHP